MTYCFYKTKQNSWVTKYRNRYLRMKLLLITLMPDKSDTDTKWNYGNRLSNLNHRDSPVLGGCSSLTTYFTTALWCLLTLSSLRNSVNSSLWGSGSSGYLLSGEYQLHKLLIFCTVHLMLLIIAPLQVTDYSVRPSTLPSQVSYLDFMLDGATELSLVFCFSFTVVRDRERHNMQNMNEWFYKGVYGCVRNHSPIQSSLLIIWGVLCRGLYS